MSKSYNAALYMRLSKDDETGAESASITTQRKILRNYCAENGFQIFDEYIDDGYSGTNFERPAFQRMITDIENRRVNLVITKDLSRLGREYIQSGHYQEVYFPMKGVRFIALGDGYDSLAEYSSDIAPLKNIINEFYARDTSRKIRSAFKAMMRDGAYVANFAPYGYTKCPDDHHQLIPDPETADTVRLIFSLASKGDTPGKIASTLTKKGIDTPLDHRKILKGLIPKEKAPWSASTISKMLSNIVYLGHTAQGKTTKLSFKSDSVIYNKRDNWIIVKNTHTPLVSKRCFEKINKMKKERLCR